MKWERILLTTDFSENARVAYPIAASIARKFGATLHIAHVLPASTTWRNTDNEAHLIRDATDHLCQEFSRQTQFSEIQTTFAVMSHRRPYQGVEEHAAKERIDLVITATHGWSGIKRFLIGSFAERLVNNAQRPVLVVRDGVGGDGPAERGGFRPQKVMVPFDFSPIAMAVLPAVRWLAAAYGCQFIFLHVYSEPEREGAYIYRLLQMWEHKELRVEERFAEIKSRELSGVRVELETARGLAPEESLRLADQHSIDLILLATHGLLGSVATSVVRAAKCQVLTVYAESNDADWSTIEVE